MRRGILDTSGLPPFLRFPLLSSSLPFSDHIRTTPCESTVGIDSFEQSFRIFACAFNRNASKRSFALSQEFAVRYSRFSS